MSLDAQILALVSEAVRDATERAERSREVMNAEQAREFLGLSPDQWKKRSGRIPARVESERKRYYLREDLLLYLKGLPVAPDYPSDYGRHEAAPGSTETPRLTA